MSGLKQTHTLVKDFTHLQKLATSENGGEFAIAFGDGLISRKTIKRDEDGEWDICHHVSDFWVDYETDEEFKEEEPNIMEAIEKGAFALLHHTKAEGGEA